jgi:hypothetical protein
MSENNNKILCNVCTRLKNIRLFKDKRNNITKICMDCRQRQRRYVKHMNDRRRYAESLKNKIYTNKIILYIH